MSTTPALAERDVVLAPRKISSKQVSDPKGRSCTSFTLASSTAVSNYCKAEMVPACRELCFFSRVSRLRGSLLIVRSTNAQTTRRWKDSAIFLAFHTTRMNRFSAYGQGVFFLSLPMFPVIMPLHFFHSVFIGGYS